MTLLAGCLALLFAPDCTGDSIGVESEESTGGSETVEDAPAGVVIAAAIWTLAWDTEGVTFPEAGGLELETDLGYRVSVQSGRISSHSVSFGACDASAGGAGGAGASRARSISSSALARWGLPVRSAHAHTEGVDPSMIETSLVEDLTAPREVESDHSFTASRYCRAHWLLARPMTPTAGPDDVAMEGRSMMVTGTFERDGEAHDFVIDTWWPHGRLVDLQDAVAADAHDAARNDGGARHAFVRVTRQLGQLFDGIDFETASDDQIAGLAIDNLVDGTDIHVDLWAPGSAR